MFVLTKRVNKPSLYLKRMAHWCILIIPVKAEFLCVYVIKYLNDHFKKKRFIYKNLSQFVR